MTRRVRLTSRGLFAWIVTGVVFCAGAALGGMSAVAMMRLEESTYSLWAALLLALMLAAPAGLALGNLARERWFASRAQAFAGVVTGLTDVQGGVRVDYVFTAADGNEVAGKDYVAHPCALEKGQAVTVLACGRRPRRNKLYPLAFFDVAIQKSLRSGCPH